VRLLLVGLALAATIGVAYRAVLDESAFAGAAERVRQVEHVADAGLVRTADLRAALYAYVAAGQGRDFWIGHARTLLEGLTGSVRELTEVASAAGIGVDAAAQQHLRTVQTAEARARKYVNDEQERLASDVIFTDAGTALDNLRMILTATRVEAGAAARASHMAVERQRAIAAAGVTVIWLVVTALLLPTSGKTPAVSTTGRIATPPAPASAPAARRQYDAPATKPVTTRAAAPPAPQQTAPAAPPAAPGPDLAATAKLCGDFARASDANELESLLGRAAGVLDATGLIVWLANASALYPAASWGYDPQLLSRVSSIPRDSVNQTAAAFRTGATRTSGAMGGTPAALAVPLVGPSGPVGVLSGEIRGVGGINDTTTGVAAIFAAQLVTLVGSMPSADAPPSAQQANA
jgi:hypothetical protein